MSMKLDAGEVKRQDMFLIDPAHIVVDHSLNGRKNQHDEKSIAELAESIAKFGQKQPVTVRRIEGNKVQLSFGYRRYEAVALYNSQHPDAPLKLKAIVTDANDKDSFIGNVVENIDRKTTNAVDDAHNQRRLREEYGYTEAEIASLYHVSQAWVCQVRKLLTLSDELQTKVIEGNLPVAAAMELAGLTVDEQATAVAAAITPTGEISAAEVKKVVREKKAAKGEKCGRSLREVRKFYEELNLPGVDDKIREFAKSGLAFLNGTKTEQQMENAIKKLGGL